MQARRAIGKIRRVEGFEVKLVNLNDRALDPTDTVVGKFDFDNRSSDAITVRAWKEGRFSHSFFRSEGLRCEVLIKGGKNGVHGRTLLKTVRRTYDE